MSSDNSVRGKQQLMVRLKSWFFAFAVFLLSSTLSAQQITGSIRGTVIDPSGAVVRDGLITATHIETGLSRTGRTDHDGNYVLLELPVGHYRLEVEAKSFQKYVQEGISLNVNETLSVPVHLVVGAETQKILVTADAQ
jgi:hypothetical protein